MMSAVTTWTTVIGVLVVGACFMRLLKELYPDGKMDHAAARVIRLTGLIPALGTAGLLVLCVLGMCLIPAWTEALTWVTAATALAGCVWYVEQCVRAVRKSRIP